MKKNEKGDLVIPKEMLESIEMYTTDNAYLFLTKVSEAICVQFSEKDADYGGSWQTDGLPSVHFNFKRKVDRVITQFKNGTMTSGNGENIADTLIDMATYSMMYLFYMYEKDDKVRKFVDDFINSKQTKKK